MCLTCYTKPQNHFYFITGEILLKFNKIITEINQKSGLIELFENGFTPDQVRELIIDSFRPFFENQDDFEEIVMFYMISDWVNLKKFNKDQWFLKSLKDSLTLYQNAKRINKQACFEITFRLKNEHIENGNRFWTSIYLEREKENLNLPELVRILMDDLGNLVEGLCKVFLIEYLAMGRIVRGKNHRIDDIKSLNLGAIVNELTHCIKNKDLFIIPPFKLKLSDWRNIAYHHNYRVIKKEIVCSFGPKHNRQELVLNENDLLQVVMNIAKTLEILNLTHKIFLFDNMKEVISNSESSRVYDNGRDEIWFLQFATGITAQGFEIVEFNYNDNKSKLALRELTKLDIKQRSAYVTLFLYNIWSFTLSSEVIVEYRLPNNDLYLSAFTTDGICNEIGQGQRDMGYLVENMEVKLYNENLEKFKLSQKIVKVQI